jgi:hypothetical protein
VGAFLAACFETKEKSLFTHLLYAIVEYTTGGVNDCIFTPERLLFVVTMSEGLTESGEIIAFGPKRLEQVSYHTINELQQVRQTYDPSGIEELALSMEDGSSQGVGTDAFELANPLLMGRHTPISAKKYIAEHGDYYRIAKKDRTDYQDLIPSEDGSALILIAGHRRRRAIHHLLTKNNISPINARVAGNVRDEIDFGQAIGLQLRENVYERPSPQDEARAIDLSYRYQAERLGHAPNVRLLSKQLGFSETKVREALDFASLPLSVQEYTASGVLSYSVVRQLRPLYDAFLKHYSQEDGVTQNVYAEASVREFCETILKQRLSGRTEEKISLTISNRTKEILGKAVYQQLEFGLLADDNEVLRRKDRSGRQLAVTAIGVMRHRIGLGEIKSDELEELEMLIAAHRASQQPAAEIATLPIDGLSEAS